MISGGANIINTSLTITYDATLVVKAGGYIGARKYRTDQSSSFIILVCKLDPPPTVLVTTSNLYVAQIDITGTVKVNNFIMTPASIPAGASCFTWN